MWKNFAFFERIKFLTTQKGCKDKMADTACIQRETPNLAKSMKRCNKPLMERRRRERINSSLEQLKQLVLESMRKDTSQYSKLEKADILEMTVKHLRSVQRQQLALAAAADSTVVGKYRAGFSECAQEVTRYLSQVDGLSPDTRGRLMQHLGSCVQRMQLPVSVSPPMGGPASHPHLQMPSSTPFASLPGAPDLQQQQYNIQQQQQQRDYIAAQLRNMQAAAMAQGSSPQGMTTYTGSIQMVPLSPPESHHQMSPLSAAEAPEAAYMRTLSPVDLQSRVQPTMNKPREQPNVPGTQLQIEIPTPSPRAQEVQSTTPILKCVSPYVLNQPRDSRIAVNQPVTTERVWRPW